MCEHYYVYYIRLCDCENVISFILIPLMTFSPYNAICNYNKATQIEHLDQCIKHIIISQW